jgi:hypothetical protein
MGISNRFVAKDRRRGVAGTKKEIYKSRRIRRVAIEKQ